MEISGEICRIGSLLPSRPEPGQEGNRIEDQAVASRENAAGVFGPRPSAGERFELHRRLALVGRVTAQSDHRRRGVEEPAHGGGNRRIEAPGELLLCDFTLLPIHSFEGGGETRGECRLDREVAQRDPPGRARREIATRERDGEEMTRPAVAGKVRHEELGAPGGAVVAVTGPVVGDAQHRLGDAVLGHDRGDMRVMMLHRDEALEAHLLREPRGEVVRVGITDDDFGLNPEEAAMRGEGGLEVVQGLRAIRGLPRAG